MYIRRQTIELLKILAESQMNWDFYFLDAIDDLNKMSKKEIIEFHKSIGTNRRESNSKEENFIFDIIEKFALHKPINRTKNKIL